MLKNIKVSIRDVDFESLFIIVPLSELSVVKAFELLLSITNFLESDKQVNGNCSDCICAFIANHRVCAT